MAPNTAVLAPPPVAGRVLLTNKAANTGDRNITLLAMAGRCDT